MKLSFHGAAREVTGSCHLVEVNGSRLLLDCGMIQGGQERHERNREPFPFSPQDLDAVILSHAHIDHSGRLPLLVKAGYRGPIFATAPTVALCRILLADSGRIHEEDARWKVKRLRKARKDWKWVQPLFTEEEALAVMDRFVEVDFETEREIDGAGTVTFYKAGHILGAGIVALKVRENGKTRGITFSGDLGVHGARLIGTPEAVPCPDYLLIESTYGDRQRKEVEERTELLYKIIDRTVGRGGRVIIPAFSVGRTQELLGRLNDLVEAGRLSGLPVYVDSPMAITATRTFANYPGAYSETAQDLLRKGDEPLQFPGLRLTRSVEESKEINRDKHPCVIISASGMCTAGRIKHHLKHNISDSRNTILFVGYQAKNSLGRVIESGISPVRIFGDLYDVKARIEKVEGFSAHADQDELLEWFGSLGGTPRRTFVVHGEEGAARTFGSLLRTRFDAKVEVPKLGQSFDID